MPVDAGSCYPNDKDLIPVTTGYSRGLVGYWGAVVVSELLPCKQQVNGSSPFASLLEDEALQLLMWLCGFLYADLMGHE